MLLALGWILLYFYSLGMYSSIHRIYPRTIKDLSSVDMKNINRNIFYKEGYFASMPTDSLHDMRTEICLELEKIGINVERHHYEVACSQGEINYQFDEIVKSADALQWFKYIVKNVARRHNKSATFMPKPIYGDNGSGQHVHMSL